MHHPHHSSGVGYEHALWEWWVSLFAHHSHQRCGAPVSRVPVQWTAIPYLCQTRLWLLLFSLPGFLPLYCKYLCFLYASYQADPFVLKISFPDYCLIQLTVVFISSITSVGECPLDYFGCPTCAHFYTDTHLFPATAIQLFCQGWVL